MKNQAEQWLKRTRSSLEKAMAGKVSDGILYEDLCFDCQQAVEKSLKALLVYLNIIFPFTHSITRLLELIEESGIKVPELIKDSIVLTDYTVTTRYPGDYDPVDENEYKESVYIAEQVFNWVKKQFEGEN
ncbi:MAG: DNA-binding protein [bacterium]|nr:MAG: DNA-binding protein [bacterium]